MLANFMNTPAVQAAGKPFDVIYDRRTGTTHVTSCVEARGTISTVMTGKVTRALSCVRCSSNWTSDPALDSLTDWERNALADIFEMYQRFTLGAVLHSKHLGTLEIYSDDTFETEGTAEGAKELHALAKARLTAWYNSEDALRLLDLAYAIETVDFRGLESLSGFDDLAKVPTSFKDYFKLLDRNGGSYHVKSELEEIEKRCRKPAKAEGHFLYCSLFQRSAYMASSPIADALERFKLGNGFYLIPQRYKAVVFYGMSHFPSFYGSSNGERNAPETEFARRTADIEPTDDDKVIETACILHADGLGLSDAIESARNLEA